MICFDYAFASYDLSIMYILSAGILMVDGYFRVRMLLS